MARSIAFSTLGCRVNQFESDSLVGRFHKAGYDVVGFDEEADAYVINTCTVTGKSDRKSRHQINRIRKNRPDAVLVVTGCYVESGRQKLEEFDRIDYLVDNNKKSAIFDLIDSHLNGEACNLVEGDRFAFNAGADMPHTRAALKIQDGCNNHCTYCIIPSVRGEAVSRPVEDVLKHARELLGFGYRELVLTGINISRYSYDGIKFPGLLEKLAALDGDFRIRVSSMEPEQMDEHFFEVMRHEKICRNLHLCLQSGSDRVLKRMGRKYRIADFVAAAEHLREIDPLFNITTDVITGFPGETDQDLEGTINVIRLVKFGHVHTFPFSVREGTAAEKLDGHLPEKVKSERAAMVRDVAEGVKIDYRGKLIGKPQLVLVEKVLDSGCVRGFGEYYVPVIVDGASADENSWIEVVPGTLSENSECSLNAVIA